MPICINLLSEALAEEDLRRRDPVKRAIYVGAFAVALSLVWFSSISLKSMVESSRLSAIEASIQNHTNDYAQVQANLKKIGDIQHQVDALDQLNCARFLHGNLLNALQQTYVPNVQLTSLQLSQTYAQMPAVAGKNGAPGRPGATTEHITLALGARDFSPTAGDQMQHFKDALLKQEFFANSPGTNNVRFLGVPELESPADTKPYVKFSLECRFADRIQ